MAITQQNELFLFGTTNSFGTNDSPVMYLIKTDDHGNEIWTLTIGGDKAEYGYQVVATPDSGCLLIGESASFGNGMADFFITKIDKNGLIEYFLDSIDVFMEEEMVIYPNPARKQGRIKFKNNIISEYTMTLVSVSGSIIRTLNIYPPDYNFNVSTFPNGIYFYLISSPSNSSILFKGKLLIQ